MLKYTALATDGSEIRLLRAQPRPDDNAVPAFMLEIVRLSDAGQFIYLTASEQPQNPDRTSSLSINGAEVHVVDEIFNALQNWHIRGQWAAAVWVEQLCVNQDDVRDRDLNIRLRPDILGAAQSLACPLQIGADDNGSLEPVSLLQSYLENLGLGGGPHKDQQQKEAAYGRLLETVFSKPLWQDVKLFQEFALAKEVVLVTRDRTYAWEELGNLLWQLQARDQPDNRRPVPRVLEHLHCINNIRYRVTSSGRSWKTPMLDAVTWAASLRANDPRDRLLRLFGVCFDAEQLLPRSSYGDPVAQLYTDFARALLPDVGPELLRFTQGLNLGADGGRTPDLPSWVPDWNKLPKQPTSAQKYMLEKYVNIKTASYTNNNARDSPPTPRTTTIHVSSTNILTIQALTIGRIANLTLTPPHDITPATTTTTTATTYISTHAAPAPFPPATALQLRTDEPTTIAGILAALQPSSSTHPFRDPTTQRTIGNPSAYQLQRRCLRQLLTGTDNNNNPDVVAAPSPSLPPRLRAWCAANAAFPIQDRTLAKWARADFDIHPSADDYLFDPTPPHPAHFAVFLTRLRGFVNSGMRMVATETGVVGRVDGGADAQVGDRLVWFKGSGGSFLIREEENDDGMDGDEDMKEDEGLDDHDDEDEDEDEKRRRTRGTKKKKKRFRVVCRVRLQDDYISPVARFARGSELGDADWDGFWRRGAWVDEVDLV